MLPFLWCAMDPINKKPSHDSINIPAPAGSYGIGNDILNDILKAIFLGYLKKTFSMIYSMDIMISWIRHGQYS